MNTYQKNILKCILTIVNSYDNISSLNKNEFNFSIFLYNFFSTILKL